MIMLNKKGQLKFTSINSKNIETTAKHILQQQFPIGTQIKNIEITPLDKTHYIMDYEVS